MATSMDRAMSVGERFPMVICSIRIESPQRHNSAPKSLCAVCATDSALRARWGEGFGQVPPTRLVVGTGLYADRGGACHT